MKCLLLYNKLKDVASTVNEHIDSFITFSSFNFEKQSVTNNKLSLELLNQYDLILIHYSIWIELDYNLSPYNRYILSLCKKTKVIFLQDENRGVNNLVSCIKSLNVSLIFTCIPSTEIHKVYNQNNLPGVQIHSTLTGFVNEQLVTMKLPEYHQRSLDVVYRARKLSAWYGRLCYDKYMIAVDFLRNTKKFNLKNDISALESDRIHGQAWVDFLTSAKSVLGVESGASMFDYTGRIKDNVEKHELLYPQDDFDKLEKLYFPTQDNNVKYNQISPRHFEAASLKTLMILYEGEYSGILIPWRHYVPLKKDYSNIDKVISILKDQNTWEQITEAAYNEIALNDKYKYKTFIQSFDKTIIDYFNENQLNISNEVSLDLQHNEDPGWKSKKPFFDLMLIISKLKRYFRDKLSKQYWKLDRFCHNNCDSNNPLKKMTSRLVRQFKNMVKLTDMYFKKYDKTESKLIILLNAYFSKSEQGKIPIYKYGNKLLYCKKVRDHYDITLTQKKDYRWYNLLLRKVDTCENCKWYIGI